MSCIRLLFMYLCIAYGSLYAARPIRVLCYMDTLVCDTKKFIINQIRGLRDKGFDVSVLVRKNITLDQPIPEDLINKLYWGPIEHFDLRAVDVIICQYGSLGKECADCLSKTKHPKLITFFRGADITANYEIEHGSYNTLFSIGDLFLPVCSYFGYLLTTLGCDPNKILMQPSGIQSDMFRFRVHIPRRQQCIRHVRNDDPIEIISVSRLIQKKGLADAIRAIAVLIDQGYNIHYTIVGEGKRKKALSNLAKELHIKQHVSFIGHQSNEQVAHLLQQAHIFILPSVTCPDGTQEGIANALKEAMATGLPVISTYHAGIRELIMHGESGLLVPEKDVPSLAKNIEYLITCPKIWRSMVSKARKVIESNYDVHYLNDLLAKRIETLVKG